MPQTAWVKLGEATRGASHNFGGSAICSPEQIWSPMSIDLSPTATSVTPGFRPPGQGHNDDDDDGVFGGTSTQVGPTNLDLNPYFGFTLTNTDFQVVINSNTPSYVGAGQSSDLNLFKVDVTNVQNVRTLGMRGPLLLSGWGFDIASMPAPADDSGQLFIAETGINRAFWKTGPVDLMWDDERQVWCGGLLMVEGILQEDLHKATSIDNPTTAKVLLYRSVDGSWTSMASRKKLDDSGTMEESIVLTNRDTSLEAKAGANTFVLAVRINYEWRPLAVTCTNPPSPAT